MVLWSKFLEAWMAWILSRWDAYFLYPGAREQPPQLLANPAPPNQSVNKRHGNSKFQSGVPLQWKKTEAFLPWNSDGYPLVN